MDWKKASVAIRGHLNLANTPVAVKMLESTLMMRDIKGLRQLKDTAPCHMAAWARYYREEGVVGASVDGVKCVWGAACLGMMKSPERFKKGYVTMPFAKDPEAGEHMVGALGVLGDDKKLFDALVMAPLDLTPLEPDVVVIYLTPGQALRLIIAYVHEKGEEVRSTITGQASLCSSIAHAFREKSMVVDIPCIGDRRYGLVQDQEMLVAFHVSRTEQLLEGLRATDSFSSHPFRPFVQWQVIFPPDMEPRRTELGWE
jgi:uncharacterized protein (DUF169 family)